MILFECIEYKKKCGNEKFLAQLTIICVSFKTLAFTYLPPHFITASPSCVSYFGNRKVVLPQNKRGNASQCNLLVSGAVRTM